MYVKLFQSIYQGTLRGNSNGLLVFTNLLAHADMYGVVDVHPKAIAEEVGLTLEQVKAATQELEAPDVESRSPESEGRRIVLLDGHRAWGWQIVNYVKYRTIKNEDDRREQNREAQARWRNKHKQASSEVINVDVDKPMQKQKQIQKKENTERTARGTRLPEDFQPDFQFAADAGVQNTLEEANKFRDYWKSQPGSKGVKLDWPATWRNWCRNAHPVARALPFARPDPAATVPSKPGTDPALAKAIKDSLSGVKPSAEIRQRMAELSGARS